MTDLLMTIAVGDAAADPLGAKEAVAMALEGLGNVRVVEIDVREPEQLRFSGETGRGPDAQRTTSAPARPDKPSTDTDRVQGPGRSRPTAMACCLSCASYRQGSGKDEAGKYYWGMCERTHRPVYSLKDQCRAWMTAWRA